MGQTKKKPNSDVTDADKYQGMSEEKPSFPKIKHSHDGHRKRMRARFQKSGLENFQPHEILELLLFYALPQKNTNPIAHELIQEFHSLSGVFDADIQDLKQINGISEYTAVFLKLIPQVCQRYQLDKQSDHEALDSVQKLCEYVKIRLLHATEEHVLLLCLDESLQLLHSEIASAGMTQEVMLDIHWVVACAIRQRSSRVVLAHNHPNASAAFSDADLFSTNQLKKVMDSMHIKLLDHIVVGKYGDTVSMRQMMGWADT